MSCLPFPQMGYVKSVVALDCWIQIRTEIVTPTKRYCAVILIGNTNYNIMPGDIVYWNDGSRDIKWAPAAETLQQAIETKKAGRERRLFLNRILTQETHIL